MSISLSTIVGLVAAAVFFVLVYFPSLSLLSRSLVSPYAKADVGRRLSAAATDGLVVVTMWLFFQALGSIAFLIAGGLYILMRDAIRGQSVGKLLFGLVVISLETGRPATLRHSLWRNAMLVIPGANVPAIVLEVIALTRDTQGQRLGDRIAQTQVVDGPGVKDLVEALQRWWPAGRHPSRPMRDVVGYSLVRRSARTGEASEPRERSEPAKRRASERVGGSGGAKPPGQR